MKIIVNTNGKSYETRQGEEGVTLEQARDQITELVRRSATDLTASLFFNLKDGGFLVMGAEAVKNASFEITE